MLIVVVLRLVADADRYEGVARAFIPVGRRPCTIGRGARGYTANIALVSSGAHCALSLKISAPVVTHRFRALQVEAVWFMIDGNWAACQAVHVVAARKIGFIDRRAAAGI